MRATARSPSDVPPRSGLPPVAALFLLMLAGCTSLPMQATDRLPGYGESVNQNAAMMIIDPQPALAQNTALALDGHRAEIAIIRYYTNEVIPPAPLSTSDVGSTIGGSAPGVAAAATSGAVQ